MKTVRYVADRLLSFLPRDQRELAYLQPQPTYHFPEGDDTHDNPLWALLDAMNGALQVMAVNAPRFASSRPGGLLFRKPATVSGVSATQGSTTVTLAGGWPDGASGASIVLDGDSENNRLLYVDGATGTLQFPFLGSTGPVGGTIRFDSADLPGEVFQVLEPVRTRGGGVPIRPATGRYNLMQPTVSDRVDYGRVLQESPTGNDQAYYIDSYASPKGVIHRMMLRRAFDADTVVEYQGKAALGTIGYDDLTAGGEPPVDPLVYPPIPQNFVESIFIPLALQRFFSLSIFQNYDTPGSQNEQAISRADADAALAMEMLRNMRPQARRRGVIYPGW